MEKPACFPLQVTLPSFFLGSVQEQGFFFETESVSPGKATCVSLSLEARGVEGMFGVRQPDFQVCRSGPTWASEAPGLQAISCVPKQVVQTHLRRGNMSGFPTGREAVPKHCLALLG